MFKRAVKSKVEKLHERGVALTEFLLTAPFLLIMCAGIVDMGMVLGQYVRLSEATHTGLRLGVSYTQLEDGCFHSTLCPTQTSCTPASSSPLHQNILARVEDLLRLNKSRIDLNTLCLKSIVQPSPTEPTRETIQVSVEATYKAIFPGISQVPITISASGPLLN